MQARRKVENAVPLRRRGDVEETQSFGHGDHGGMGRETCRLRHAENAPSRSRLGIGAAHVGKRWARPEGQYVGRTCLTRRKTRRTRRRDERGQVESCPPLRIWMQAGRKVENAASPQRRGDVEETQS